MLPAAWLIAWSIRLSIALMVATLLAWLLASQSRRNNLLIKTMWTASFALILVHVLASFHFVHHWSHQAAYLATAQETGELMGVQFGGGVYFNYLFLAAWGVHVWYTWFPPTHYRRLVGWLLQLCLCYLLFIAFNGVVVFKAGWLRALGILATGGLVVVATRKAVSMWSGDQVGRAEP